MIAANIPATDIQLPDLVDIHLPCRVCYQDLLNKSVDAKCPQCGTPVEVSYQRDLMRFANPHWVNTLRLGINLIISGIIVGVLGALFIMGLALATRHRVESGEVLMIMLASYLMTVLGWWALTSPDPSGLGESHYGFSRKIIRLALLVGVANQGFTLLTQSAELTPTLEQALGVVAIVVTMLGALAYLANFHYLAKLALRIPDYKLSGRAMFLMWANVVCISLIAMVVVRASTDGPQRIPAADEFVQILGPFGILIGFAMLVFVFMFVRLLAGLSKVLKYQIDWLKQKSSAPRITH
jgi:hypothetical protein